MAHSRLKFLGLAGVALMLLAACGSSNNTPAAKVYKIGLVTDIGGLNDKSFNHLADLGLEKAKTDFKIQGDVKESKSGDDYIPNLTDFAIIDGAGTDAKGNDLKHANVQSLYFKEQDAGAMVGAMAGWLEKNGKAKKNLHVVSAVGG